jgi:AcrR family transcriptional regulator
MGTDERIVVAMAELMRVQGYTATGVNQLVRAAGAPTGSIYHHFKGGKRDVAAAALRQTGAAYGQLMPMLLDAHDDLATAIEAAFASAAEDIETTGWATMCPVATVTAEVANTEPELRQVGAGVMTAWVEQGSRYLTTRGLPEDRAREAAYALITAIEGAFLLARGLRSTEPLLAVGRAVAAYVTSLASTPHPSPDVHGNVPRAG